VAIYIDFATAPVLLAMLLQSGVFCENGLGWPEKELVDGAGGGNKKGMI